MIGESADFLKLFLSKGVPLELLGAEDVVDLSVLRLEHSGDLVGGLEGGKQAKERVTVVSDVFLGEIEVPTDEDRGLTEASLELHYFFQSLI